MTVQRPDSGRPDPTVHVDVLAPLVEAAQRGSSDAVAALVRATERDVMRFLRSLAPAVDAEDLTQETFLRVVRALPGFAGRSSVRTWLFAIARRVAADHARRAACRPRVAALPDWQTSAESAVGPSASCFKEHHALADLVRCLPPQRRDAFLLTQVAGLSYAEAAAALGCPIGTVRSRVARARDDLIVAMRDDGPAVRTRAS